MNSLVSILTPCYNAEKYIPVLIESILNQSYPRIEVIFVNDGSVDQTKNVIFSFEDKFRAKGYILKYIEQENAGQAYAINNGLKLVQGDYLIWPDSDDWFYNSTTISTMVSFLDKSSDEYTCVRVLPWYVDEVTHQKRAVTISRPEHENLFNDFLEWNENVWAPAGSMMIKSEKLFSVLSDRLIYASRNVGQNHQLLLPVLCQGKCKTITEHLFCILVRKGSHSRGTYDSYKKEINRWNESETMLIETIKSLPLAENICTEKIGQIKHLYRRARMRTAKKYSRWTDLFKYFVQL